MGSGCWLRLLLRSLPYPSIPSRGPFSLRNKSAIIKYFFRRQHPLSKYVVDFYCHALQFLIEVDGRIHEDKIVQMEDRNKEESLKSYGLYIIRFTNDEVINKMDWVIETIKKEILLIQEKGPL